MRVLFIPQGKHPRPTHVCAVWYGGRNGAQVFKRKDYNITRKEQDDLTIQRNRSKRHPHPIF